MLALNRFIASFTTMVSEDINVYVDGLSQSA
jgi:hypothetical protein